MMSILRSVRLFAVMLIFSSCTATPAFAQKNCDLGAQRFDNPFSDHGGWTMPRVAWHVFDAEEAFAVSDLLQVFAHVPRRIAVLMPLIASLALHVRGYRLRLFKVNRLDWAFDAMVRSGPLLATIPNPLYGAAIYGASYATLFCYAHP